MYYTYIVHPIPVTIKKQQKIKIDTPIIAVMYSKVLFSEVTPSDFTSIKEDTKQIIELKKIKKIITRLLLFSN